MPGTITKPKCPLREEVFSRNVSVDGVRVLEYFGFPRGRWREFLRFCRALKLPQGWLGYRHD